MSKISVIVPVYNSASFLSKCVQSIKEQTYTNWELILVDDGSKDNSLELMQQFSFSDSRIKIIHQENMGPGLARNTGIQFSTGEYIVFVDSDDFIAPDYFYELSMHDEDVVFIDVQTVDKNHEIIKNEFLSSYKNLSKEDFLRSQMTGKINWGGVRKATKKTLLFDYSIYYSEHKIGEEAIFSFNVLNYATTIGFIDKPVYYYLQRNDSQSHLKIDDPWGKVALTLKEQIQNNSTYSDYANTINAFILTAAAVSVNKLALNYDFKDFLIKTRERYNQLQKDLDLKYSIDYKHMSLQAKFLGYLLKQRLYYSIWFLSRIRNFHH